MHIALTSTLPRTGFLRLPQIIGSRRTTPPTPGLLPISRSKWYDGIKRGIYPAPVKLGPRVSAWRVEDIRQLIASLGAV